MGYSCFVVVTHVGLHCRQGVGGDRSGTINLSLGFTEVCAHAHLCSGSWGQVNPVTVLKSHKVRGVGKCCVHLVRRLGWSVCGALCCLLHSGHDWPCLFSQEATEITVKTRAGRVRFSAPASLQDGNVQLTGSQEHHSDYWSGSGGGGGGIKAYAFSQCSVIRAVGKTRNPPTHYGHTERLHSHT